MSLESVLIGQACEDLVASLLSKLPGTKILQRNYRIRGGEVDVIVEETHPDGSIELVFVEIRKRDAGSFVDGIGSVNWAKRRKLEITARVFLSKYRGPALGVRFDIVSLDGQTIKRLSNAWNMGS